MNEMGAGEHELGLCSFLHGGLDIIGDGGREEHLAVVDVRWQGAVGGEERFDSRNVEGGDGRCRSEQGSCYGGQKSRDGGSCIGQRVVCDNHAFGVIKSGKWAERKALGQENHVGFGEMVTRHVAFERNIEAGTEGQRCGEGFIIIWADRLTLAVDLCSESRRATDMGSIQI